MKQIIERNIRVYGLIIYILVSLICFSGIIYFYGVKKDFNKKKEKTETYTNDLFQIGTLIHEVNDAQSEVNQFVITGSMAHIRKYNQKANEINQKIDSLQIAQNRLHVDKSLKEITLLLKEKKQSVIFLTRQLSHNNVIDSLSNKIMSLSLKVRKHALDSVKNEVEATSARSKKKNIFKRFSNAINNRNSAEEASRAIDELSKDSNAVTMLDTLMIDQLVHETKKNYVRHISEISDKVQTAIMTDQFLSFRITELLMTIYNHIVDSRMEEVRNEGYTVNRDDTRVVWLAIGSLTAVLLCLIFIFRNTNKGYKARIALAEANEKNRKLLEGRHKLILSVSHDVKTPLNSILGYTEIYKQDGKLTPEETAPIFHSGNHILALLTNLLEFSSLEKGSLTLVSNDFRLEDLCRELKEVFIPLADKKKLTFEQINNFPAGLILQADLLKIKQILMNLLSNSIKYTQRGKITMETSFNEGQLQFWIKDTGIGIPIEKRPSIFQPFTRIVENSVLEEGNGFGLFVVKGLVELFAGKIDIRSELNKGTHVNVMLPVSKGSIQEDTSSKNILIIDDDELSLHVLTQFCHKLGHAVFPCLTLEAFSSQIQAIDEYDFILTDMGMGHFSGEDVLRLVSESPHPIPIVLVSGNSDISRDNLLKQGFKDFLQKPVSIEALKSVIGGKWQGKEKQTEHFLAGMSSKENEKSFVEKFIMNTINNVVLLRKSILAQDPEKIRFMVHKMRPTFLLLHAPEKIVTALNNMEMSGNGKYSENDELYWQAVNDLLLEIEKFLQELEGKYLN